ncbi:MAG TPA: tetratricopeptide repeat protein, partial [Candidatus Bathyarchaeia archaeon]|nr:tetratricopeptide repeat protein [Candidatus Bathyarchaeia archaeon]
MRLRETGSVSFLDLATRAAQASLRAMPETQNLGAVAVLAQSEQASHDFRAARGHAERLVELAPDHSEAYQILGDALLELGEYEPARAAFARMQQQVEQNAESRVNLDTRLGQLAWLEGNVEAARTHFTQA